MNYIYILSSLILLILTILIKKSNNKLNIIINIMFTIVGFLAYQLIICLIFSSLNIPIDFLYISIFNILITIVFAIFIKKNGIQKFYFNKIDCIITIVLTILVAFIANKQFDGLEKIKYFSTDASIHYLASKEFSQNVKLLNETETTQTYKQMLPMLYTNVGLAFKAIEPIIGEINLYKIYIVFDVLIFWLIGITFYFIVKRAIKNTRGYVLVLAITIIYLLGYPLNNLVTGFGYLGFCLVFINLIILVMQNIKRQDVLKQFKLLVLLVLNLAVMFSYNIFTVLIYLSEFIYFINLSKKQNNKKIIIDILITLVVPGVLGIIYFILPNISAIKAITLEGYIYQNMWSNFVLFIPFILYYMYKVQKSDFNIILFIVCLVCILIFFIATKYKIISEYYAYKTFYVFWGIVIVLCFYGMMEFASKSNKKLIISTTFLITYILGIFLVTENRNIHIKKKEDESLVSCFDIYCINKQLMNLRMELNKNELDAIKYVELNDLLNIEKQNILFISDYIQDAWIRVLLNYGNREGKIEENNYVQQIQKWNNFNYEYLVCFQDSDIYKKYNIIINSNGAETIFSNEDVKIYKKN